MACLKIAYTNCLNDLSRTKKHLAEAEETLRALSRILVEKAQTLNIQISDNPGSGGSGGSRV